MRPDPLVRDDHRCARWGCRKPLPKLAIVHADPFCSCECCRIYHGNPMPTYGNTFGRKGREKAA